MTAEQREQLIEAAVQDFVDQFAACYADARETVQPPVVGHALWNFFPELSGQPLDRLAIGMIHMLRPTSIHVRELSDPGEVVVTPEGAVTVYVTNENRIVSVTQHVPVALHSGQEFKEAYNRAQERGDTDVRNSG